MDGTGDDDADRDQAGATAKADRRHKHEAKQAAAGYTRCIVRCHVDDVEKIKAYAATLIAKRKAAGP